MPTDIGSVAPGAVDAATGVVVREVVYRTYDRVVYLDRNWDVHWRGGGAAAAVSLPLMEAEVARLESFSDAMLGQRRPAFRRLVVKGVVEVVASGKDLGGSGTPPAASLLFARAEAFYRERAFEAARRWHLSAGSVLAAGSLVAVAAVVLLRYRSSVQVLQEDVELYRTCTAALLGGLGASTSMILRVSHLAERPEAGPLLHTCEAISRFLLGVITGGVVVLCARCGIALSALTGSSTGGHALLFLTALVSGASERFLPGIIGRGEAGGGGAKA